MKLIKILISINTIGDRKLVETGGRGPDRWSGYNGLLGKLLEQVRAELIADGTVDVEELTALAEAREKQRQDEIEAKRAARAAKKGERAIVQR